MLDAALAEWLRDRWIPRDVLSQAVDLDAATVVCGNMDDGAWATEEPSRGRRSTE